MFIKKKMMMCFVVILVFGSILFFFLIQFDGFKELIDRNMMYIDYFFYNFMSDQKKVFSQGFFLFYGRCLIFYIMVFFLFLM